MDLWHLHVIACGTPHAKALSLSSQCQSHVSIQVKFGNVVAGGLEIISRLLCLRDWQQDFFVATTSSGPGIWHKGRSCRRRTTVSAGANPNMSFYAGSVSLVRIPAFKLRTIFPWAHSGVNERMPTIEVMHSVASSFNSDELSWKLHIVSWFWKFNFIWCDFNWKKYLTAWLTHSH